MFSLLFFSLLLLQSERILSFIGTTKFRSVIYQSVSDSSNGVPESTKNLLQSNLKKNIYALSLLVLAPMKIKASETSTTVDLNIYEPKITDICWFDIQIGDDTPQRVEFGLYGTIVPITVENFKKLSMNSLDYGYKNSNIFRIVSEFSIQGGNIGSPGGCPPSRLGRYGLAAKGTPFSQENFRILHDYKDAGVISMMKDIKTSMQDSRFFITTKPAASWADEKYVAFGRVITGMKTILALSEIPVEPPSNFPKTKVVIVNSGCDSLNIDDEKK